VVGLSLLTAETLVPQLHHPTPAESVARVTFAEVAVQKVLNQKEIDALFLAANQQGKGEGARPQDAREVLPLEYDRAGRITKDQVQALSILHDTFARNLSHSLGAYLRVMFEANVVSLEQLSYMEFLQRIPEITYLAAFHLQPLGTRGVLQMDLSLAIPLIDLLLGGKGKAEPQQREITEIEEQLLESVVQTIIRELQQTWRPLLSLDFLFHERLHQTQVLQMMPPNEKTLSLLFEIRIPEARGQINLILPSVVSSSMFRKLSQQWSYRKSQDVPKDDGPLRERVLDCNFPIELVLPTCKLPARELIDLQPGRVLTFPHRVEAPAILAVSGKKLFHAYPIRSGNFVAAQVQERLRLAAGSPE
jgi:flagellar motor switch protein FliM